MMTLAADEEPRATCVQCGCAFEPMGFCSQCKEWLCDWSCGVRHQQQCAGPQRAFKPAPAE